MDKKPLFSKSVSAGPRVYYMDAYADSQGSHFLSISEIPKGKRSKNRKRQRVFVHAEHLEEFGAAVAEIIGKIISGQPAPEL